MRPSTKVDWLGAVQISTLKKPSTEAVSGAVVVRWENY